MVTALHSSPPCMEDSAVGGAQGLISRSWACTFIDDPNKFISIRDNRWFRFKPQGETKLGTKAVLH